MGLSTLHIWLVMVVAHLIEAPSQESKSTSTLVPGVGGVAL